MIFATAQAGEEQSSGTNSLQLEYNYLLWQTPRRTLLWKKANRRLVESLFIYLSTIYTSAVAAGIKAYQQQTL